MHTELGSWQRAWQRVGKAEVQVEVDAGETIGGGRGGGGGGQLAKEEEEENNSDKI